MTISYLIAKEQTYSLVLNAYACHSDGNIFPYGSYARKIPTSSDKEASGILYGMNAVSLPLTGRLTLYEILFFFFNFISH